MSNPELLSQPGGVVYAVEAPVWDQTASSQVRNDHLVVGITPAALGNHLGRGFSVHLGQFYGIVVPGLIHAQHLFRGLKRAMMVGANGDVARYKMAASWKQSRDAYLSGDKSSPQLSYRDPPPAGIFVVYISRNVMLSEFPQIYGWLEHWTWVAADPEAVGAPIDWKIRFDERLWTAQ